MALINNCILKILTDCKVYCCLCFQTVEEKDMTKYDLRDEIVLQTRSININEILFTVLGEEVMNSLSSSTICQKCTVLAINSYNFIENSKNNVLKISCNINCLLKYFVNATAYNSCHKSLFLVLDTVSDTIHEFYDENKCHRSRESSYKRFQHLLTSALGVQCENNSQDIYYETENHDTNGTPVLDISPKQKKTTNDSNKKKHKQASESLIDLKIFKKNNDKKHHKCEDCSKEYKNALRLKLHHLHVHAPKTFKCNQCPKSFGSSSILSHHISNSHCTAVCRYCGKTYTNSSSLRHHEKTHEVRFKCKSCGKVYKGKLSFKKHVEQNLCEKIRSVNSGPKHACNYCDKKYSQISGLNVHIRLEHENGKALKCDWCGKKLSSQSKLKEHIVKHTKHKNFECDICGGKFVTKPSLLYHTRTHTGEKPYKCEYCNMNFLSASRRSQHVRRFHSGPDLECDICNKKFKEKTCLIRHIKRHFDVSSRLYHHLIPLN